MELGCAVLSRAGGFPTFVALLWTQVSALQLTLQAKAPRNIGQQLCYTKHFEISLGVHKWRLSGTRADHWLFDKSLTKYAVSQNAQKILYPSKNKNLPIFLVLSCLIGKSMAVISWRSHSTYSSFEAFFTHLKSRNVFSFRNRD